MRALRSIRGGRIPSRGSERNPPGSDRDRREATGFPEFNEIIRIHPSVCLFPRVNSNTSPAPGDSGNNDKMAFGVFFRVSQKNNWRDSHRQPRFQVRERASRRLRQETRCSAPQGRYVHRLFNSGPVRRQPIVPHHHLQGGAAAMVGFLRTKRHIQQNSVGAVAGRAPDYNRAKKRHADQEDASRGFRACRFLHLLFDRYRLTHLNPTRFAPACGAPLPRLAHRSMSSSFSKEPPLITRLVKPEMLSASTQGSRGWRL